MGSPANPQRSAMQQTKGFRRAGNGRRHRKVSRTHPLASRRPARQDSYDEAVLVKQLSDATLHPLQKCCRTVVPALNLATCRPAAPCCPARRMLRRSSSRHAREPHGQLSAGMFATRRPTHTASRATPWEVHPTSSAQPIGAPDQANRLEHRPACPKFGQRRNPLL